MKFTKTLLGAAALMGAATLANAQANPAIIYDLGGKFDKSFNESAYTGAQRFADETGIEYREFELQSDAQREQALRRFAQAGNNPVVVTGFSYGTALATVAPEFPDTNFVIVDSVVEGDNVRSVVFNEQEGSYLVGVLAAMASKSGVVGFVGGMDIPLIQKFSCGYAQGVLATNPDATVIANMTGTTGAAWNDPVRGGELTMGQIESGADVVYHAAGGTGRGVLQAAADAGILGIGVDSNQNGMFPGSVLTSMLKRVDVAVYDAFMDVQNGEFTSGVVVLGLAENGVGYAMDENNAALITPEMQAAVDAASAGIIDGSIVVHNYESDMSCPVQ
ncbi:BMP family ABC transporter substrate-binding protein [Abyssibius alkaniclasticus]|uniref:BMP family lipoprotein n=1 Tax=Abyssibius alkaniclasticus TaxID=2881234 RepID=UPI002363802A|nr:BMP family ABC transporter substrate-binding protein [Abyssibius alkaniclasticus]UPH71599.1 BMP family ABC transporter substrate-binding protein [Abyssibius alkaniclasticus]